jgi:hypothetical protein
MSRKVMDSITIEVTGFFINVILSATLWPTGLTQPVTEMNARFPWGLNTAGA